MIVLAALVLTGYMFSLAFLKEPVRKYTIVLITTFCLLRFVLTIGITLRAFFVPTD